MLALPVLFVTDLRVGLVVVVVRSQSGFSSSE